MAAKASAPEPTSAPKRKSKLKIILIIVVLIVLLIGGAISFWWFQMRQPGAPRTPAQNSGQTSGQTADQSAGQPAGQAPGAGGDPSRPADMPRMSVNSVSLPTVLVNLADPAGDRYLKVGMDVEVSSPEAVQEIQSQTAKIRDAIIILFSSKTYADLASGEGKVQLKNEVAARLNQILGSPRVVRIYFTEFVVQ